MNNTLACDFGFYFDCNKQAITKPLGSIMGIGVARGAGAPQLIAQKIFKVFFR